MDSNEQPVEEAEWGMMDDVLSVLVVVLSAANVLMAGFCFMVLSAFILVQFGIRF